jgi:hypothetical protein
MRADAGPKDPAFERQPLHTAGWKAGAASMAAAPAPRSKRAAGAEAEPEGETQDAFATFADDVAK